MAIVAVLVVAGALGWWLGSDDDEAAEVAATTSTTTPLSTAATATSATTATSTTSTTSVAPTGSWALGLEWVGDGSAPAPGVVELGGAYVVELGLATSLVRDADGTWIWLAREIGRQEPYGVFQLVDAVPTTGASDTDVFVLGATSCTVGGTPTTGVVAVFSTQDAAQLTDPTQAWVISPASASLVAPGGPVVCENEGWGV